MGYKFGNSEFSCGSLSEFLLYLAFFQLWYAQIYLLVTVFMSTPLFLMISVMNFLAE